MTRRLARLALLVVAPAFPAAVPTAGQVPTAGVEVELVRLDVVATDASGSPAPDLACQDFEVLEDGKPQRIASCIRPGDERHPSGAAAAPRQVVIVVDDLHLARESVGPARAALLRFVDAQAAPEDRIALVVTSAPAGSLPLTRDRVALRQAVGRVASRVAASEGGNLQLDPAQAELILRGDQSALRLAARQLMDDPTSTLIGRSPRAVVESTSGANPAGLDPEEVAAAREAEREARAVLAGTLRFSQMTLVTVEAALRVLETQPGRKLLLLVSDGFLVGRATSEEQTQALRLVTDAATRGGAAVYAMDARGLGTGGADASVVGPASDPGLRDRVARQSREETRGTLQRLVDETGGLLVTDAEAGLARMLADNASYYLVAYEPTNAKHDGRYRKIELRLPRHPGLAVRTRRGYFAPTRDQQRDAAGRRSTPKLTSLVGAPDVAASTLGLTLSSLVVSSAAGAPDAGAGQEAQAPRRFRRSDTLYFQLYVSNPRTDETGATDVVLQAQIHSGGQAIAASKPAPVAFPGGASQQLEGNSMSLESLTPGSYELRVVVVDRKASTTVDRRVPFSVE